MGGGKGGGSVPGEFAGLADAQSHILRALLQAGQGGFHDNQTRNPFSQFGGMNPDTTRSAAGLFGESGLGYAEQAAGAGPSLFQDALDALQTGINEGFTPDIVAGVESRLRPSVNRSFEQGAANVFEQSARAGTTRSTGTTQDLFRLSTDLENQLQQTLGGIESQLAPIEAQQRMGATQMGLGFPQESSNFLQSLLGPVAQESQFQRGLLGGAGGAAAGQNIPFQAGKSEGQMYGNAASFAAALATATGCNISTVVHGSECAEVEIWRAMIHKFGPRVFSRFYNCIAAPLARWLTANPSALAQTRLAYARSWGL